MGVTVFGENLKKVREAAGISQYVLAQHLGVHPMTISGWERGVRLPDIETVVKIAEYFNVPTDFLLGNAPPPEDLSSLPTELYVMFRAVDWKALTEDEKRIVSAVIRSISEKNKDSN